MAVPFVCGRKYFVAALSVSAVLPILIIMHHQHVMTFERNMMTPFESKAETIAARTRQLVGSTRSRSAVLANAVDRATLIVEIQNQTLRRLRADLAVQRKELKERNSFASKINHRFAESKRNGGMTFIHMQWHTAAHDALRGPSTDSGKYRLREAYHTPRSFDGRVESSASDAPPAKERTEQKSAPTQMPLETRERMRFAHIVNFLPRGIGHSDQEVTVQSMANAKAFAEEWAAAGEETLLVELYSAEYAEDFHSRVSRDTSIIKVAPNLKRHVYDLYDLKRFEQIKFQKLPLLSDILQSAVDASDAPYIIYSNADIGLQPDFYVQAAKYMREGRSALAVNRVEIPIDDDHNSKLGKDDMEEIYALGRKHKQQHKGYDCFVFHRNLVPFLQLYLRGAFLGYPPIGSKMNDALGCVADYFVVRGKHLTFHLGIKNGGWGEDSEFEFYNRKAVKQSAADFESFMRSVAAGGGTACTVAKRAARDPGGNISERTRAEVNRRSFVFPKYPKIPDWEAAFLRNMTLRRNKEGNFNAIMPAEVSSTMDSRSASMCMDPESVRPKSPVRKLILASSGRVGSTMLAEVLSHHGIRVDHTHLSVERISSDQRKAKTMAPVLFIFADPVDVVLSLRQRDIDTGDSFFGKNISWVRKHLENMQQDHLFSAWANRDYFKTDVLQLEEHFRAWHRPMPFPFMSLRYETEREHLDKLSAFLGTIKPIVLPALGPGRPIAGSKGKVPRGERFRRLNEKEQLEMKRTYGALQERIASAPDFCIWRRHHGDLEG
jgi:hypothetical protein